jgi:type IV pilus assembly protein PilA
MKNINNKSGFTLIEIIVVLIIIGVLASIALPNLFSNIPRSKASTALASADAYKTVLETCFGQNSGVIPNGAPCSIGGQNLTTIIQTITLALTDASGGTGNAGNGGLTYTLKGTDGSGTVPFTITRATNGTFTCAAPTAPASPYSNLC